MHPLESHFNHSKSVVDIVDVQVSTSSVAAPYSIPSTLSAIISAVLFIIIYKCQEYDRYFSAKTLTNNICFIDRTRTGV